MAAASTSGSPRSRPSEQTTTTPPRNPPRHAHVRRYSRIDSPIRVPPCQSTTVSAARRNASSGSRRASAPETRVRRVPKQKTSTRARPPRDRVRELEQPTRIGGHRARDVQEEDERTCAQPRPPTRDPEVGAAVADVRAQRTPQVRTDALPRPLGAARLPLRRGDHETRHQPADGVELVGVAVGEVLVAQELDFGGRLPDAFRIRTTLTTGRGGERVGTPLVRVSGG